MTDHESSGAASGFEQAAAPRSAAAAAKRILPRGLTLAAILVVSVYLQAQARNLWHEWVLLQGEVQETQRNAFVGYLDIAPDTSYAQPPVSCVRQEGEHSLLWSGWQHGVGHQWFRFERGEIDPARICQPNLGWISRAIDYPVVESRGGRIWQRIPPQAVVVGHNLEGQKCVYPFAVLQKVQVVNDVVGGRAFLIVANRLAPEHRAISVFKGDLDGRRLTMAGTGYYHDGKPLLFDRKTESLWLEEKSALRAVAGKLKNTPLERVGGLVPVTWGAWLSQNGQGRLLVGADRSHGIPEE
jgi:hypothetical protein